MSFIEIILLAIGLSMDSLAVSVTNGILIKNLKFSNVFRISSILALFQAGMTLIGFLAGMSFRKYITEFDHWVAFILLIYLGGKMIYESFKPEEEKHFNPNSLKVTLALSVATSIDALAVGISFSCIGYRVLADIWQPVTIIGLVSLVLAFAGFMIGIFAGKRFHFPVERLGGILLIGIGLKILYTHLYGG